MATVSVKSLIPESSPCGTRIERSDGGHRAESVITCEKVLICIDILATHKCIGSLDCFRCDLL